MAVSIARHKSFQRKVGMYGKYSTVLVCGQSCVLLFCAICGLIVCSLLYVHGAGTFLRENPAVALTNDIIMACFSHMISLANQY